MTNPWTWFIRLFNPNYRQPDSDWIYNFSSIDWDSLDAGMEKYYADKEQSTAAKRKTKRKPAQKAAKPVKAKKAIKKSPKKARK